jgi:hypothetical protein
VANPPCQYDADGSVLRGMGPRLLAFWRHCYGADGGCGAMAQVAAEARRTLRKLCAVPRDGLEPGAAAAWAPLLFREQSAAGTALSLRAFLAQAAAAGGQQRVTPAKGGVNGQYGCELGSVQRVSAARLSWQAEGERQLDCNPRGLRLADQRQCLTTNARWRF